MLFTYKAYKNLIRCLKQHGYTICSYDNWEHEKRCAILRHDIDNDLGKAIELAKVENEVGVKSTFFVLISSDFYNVFSSKSEQQLHAIADCGHDIGLHFDEVKYPGIMSPEDAKKKIQQEVKILESATGTKVTAISMHRPSKMILEANLEIPGLINSYSHVFFKNFKYLSDSRRHWKEPINAIVKSEQFDRLHILTHAFWYNEQEINIHDTICQFVNSGNRKRYEIENENITGLCSIMRETEIIE